MALQNTNLLVVAGKLPPTFQGTPQEFADALIRRLRIVSPSGINFIVIGDVEPTSNVGPWLKNGTQWWVFDTTINRYQPLDISESETQWFQVGATTPATSTPPVWLRTTHDQTDVDPSIGSPIGWYIFDGTNWVPFISLVQSGPTASRPNSPQSLQMYYDSTISCLIWYERSAWRTVSGVPGDIKHVAFTTLSEALTANPGWEVFGGSNQTFRGRFISQATKDSGGSPETVLNVDAGIPERAAFETYGATAPGLKTDGASVLLFPGTIALWTLVKV